MPTLLLSSHIKLLAKGKPSAIFTNLFTQQSKWHRTTEWAVGSRPYRHCIFMTFILLNVVQFLGIIYLFIIPLYNIFPAWLWCIQLRESVCRRTIVGGNKLRALFNSQSLNKSYSLLHKHFSTNASTVCSSHLLLSRWWMTHFQCNLSKNNWNWW